MNGLKLYVDDLRQAPEGWVRARTITQAIRTLHELRVDEVSLDHDIVFVDERGRWIGTSQDEDFTPVARFIADMPEQYRPKVVHIHTSNPNGRDRLTSILKGKVELVQDFAHAKEWAADPLCREFGG